MERNVKTAKAMNHSAKPSDPKHAGPRPPFEGERLQRSPGSEQSMTNAPDYGRDSYRGSGKLQGKVALITGADSGIGRAVALAFAREGAHVAIAYLDEHEDAEETRRAVLEADRQALLLSADISSEAACRDLVARTVEKLGRIDVLVNNAAYQGKAIARFEELDAERIEHTFRVNVFAMFALVRAALPHMREGSAIINTASVQAYDPSPEILDYAATKGAIVTFTKGLAQETIKRGIRANVVAPGPVWTPLIVQSFDAEKVKSFGAHSPMGRPAQPAELASTFVLLASEDGQFINGEVLGVTGGRLLG